MNLLQYESGRPELDYILINWHTQIINSIDFDLLFSSWLRSPVAFCNFFLPPKVLAFDLSDKSEVAQAIWVDPFMQGGYLSMWASPLLRTSLSGHKRIFMFFTKVVDILLEHFPVLISVIRERGDGKQTEKFLRMHVKLGFYILGSLPEIFNGHDSTVLYLKRADFERANKTKMQKLEAG